MIRDVEFFSIRILDQEVKKSPDPGSRSATLKLRWVFFLQEVNCTIRKELCNCTVKEALVLALLYCSPIDTFQRELGAHFFRNGGLDKKRRVCIWRVAFEDAARQRLNISRHWAVGLRLRIRNVLRLNLLAGRQHVWDSEKKRHVLRCSAFVWFAAEWEIMGAVEQRAWEAGRRGASHLFVS